MIGTVYRSKSKSGRQAWRYQIDAGRDQQGKRIRVGESGFKLQREANDAMQEKMRELKRGAVNTRVTLEQYMEQWLPYHASAKPLAPKTVERYESLAAHATKALGSVSLKDLTPFMFDDLYVKLAKPRLIAGKIANGLSAKTIREVHNVVHVALRRAVKAKLIPFNPTDGCDLPRIDQKEAIALSPDQLAAYEQSSVGSWLNLLIRLAAATGARRGELLACRWSDLDWSTSKLRIERSLYQIKGEVGLKPTKTRQARKVTIPPSLVEYLKLHREQQEQHRTMFGVDYQANLDLMFADPSGGYLLPSSVTRAAVRLAKKAGLASVGLHTLRHTHASILLHNGVPVTNVSKRLGHRDPYTTAKIYAHALPDSDQDVAATWDKVTAESGEQKLPAQFGTIQNIEKLTKQ